MARVRDRVASQVWLWIGLGAFSVLALPAACVFPDYTFNETGAAASGSTSASSSGNPSSSAASTSGSSQGGGGSSASSSAAGSTSGTGGAGQEFCLNTVDDDGDSLIDCADPDCGDYACVPPAPIGWSNDYILLFVGTPGQEPPCPSLFPSSSPFTGISGINFTAPTCDPCSCAQPSGQTCDLPDKIQIANTPCGMPPGTFPRELTVPQGSWNGSCSAPDAQPGGDTFCNSGPCNVSVRAAAATVLGGSCMPQGGTPTISPVTWNGAARGCGDAPLGGGCAAPEVCQPHPPGEPFLTGLCVYKDGDHACPSGPFNDRHLFYQNVTDTRGCTACQCGSPSGSTCSANFTVYSDLNQTCTTPLGTFSTGGCANITGNPPVAGRSAVITPPSGGSCPASGGQPMGTVTPALPTTFCCIP